MSEAKSNELGDFRLSSGEEVVKFMQIQICGKNPADVDLSLISIILGFIEHRLTVNVPPVTTDPIPFPVVTSDDIIPLVNDFRQYITEKVAPKSTTNEAGEVVTDRQTIKDVASAVWKRLSRSFHKDKLHYQTLYTFKNGSHLDCFGLAYAVAAGCQVLNCKDVHLCLSEDHAWITFGPDGSQTAEITWNGKQNEAYRGEPIDNGLVSPKNWLYLGGNPVKCSSRRMEATAAVAMINPNIDGKSSSSNETLSRLQQDLLWMLYDAGCLSEYPMALCILTKLEEKHPTAGRPDSGEIFHQAIECSRSVYGDNHVYPHTEYGCYLYRKRLYDMALYRWQQAANVLRKYCYNREEEELHKEMATIAHDLIPDSFKSVVDSGSSAFFESTDNLSNLLLFYDGICEWEQNGTTPIFHNFWVKPFAQAISYFPHGTRMALLSSPGEDDDSGTPVVAAPLPRSPVKNVDAYHRSLVATVLNVYARSGASSETGESAVDDFLQTCETTKLKADLVWNPEVVGTAIAETPVECKLQLRSEKMSALRKILTRKLIRSGDVELVLCAQIESASGGNEGRRSKRQKIG